MINSIYMTRLTRFTLGVVKLGEGKTWHQIIYYRHCSQNRAPNDYKNPVRVAFLENLKKKHN